MQTHSQKYLIRGRGAISKVWSQSAENFAIFFGKDNLILGLLR